MLGIVTILFISTGAQAADWAGDLAITHDSNVTLAEASSDKLADSLVSLGVSKTYLQNLNRNQRLIVRPFMHVQAYSKYEDLSFIAGGVNLTYQYRASGKLLAPTWGVFVKLSVEEYNSQFRDSNRYALGASMRRAFTDRLSLATILSANRRVSDGVVWDSDDISLLLNVDYQLSQRITLYTTFDYRNGDVVSTAQPTLKIVNAAEAIQADDAFGGVAANRFAYRLGGQTFIGKLGVNMMLNETHSLDLTAWYANAQADGDNHYARALISLAYLTRF